MLKRCSIIFLTFCISACGFHLRGSVALPEELDYIAINSQQSASPIQPYLTRALQARNVVITSDTSQANLILNLISEQYTRTAGSISADTNTRQYNIVYSVVFDILSPRGDVILGAQQVRVTRSTNVDTNQLLGSTYEEDTIRNEMRREASTQILYRLSSFKTVQALRDLEEMESSK